MAQVNQKGFSLIEILVALALVAVVFSIVPLSVGGKKEELENAVSDLNRAIKIASNESILRNTITRVIIDFETPPEEGSELSVSAFSVEYGPAESLVLPKAQSLSKMGLKELEDYQKKQKKFNKKFTPVDDYKKRKLSSGIKIAAIASSYQKEIINQTRAAIYFYPTGDRDDALIFLTSPEELAVIEVFALEEQTDVKYYPLLDKYADALDNKLKDIFERWSRN